jgi:hypothetical protein
MLPRLGAKYELNIEEISQSREHYQSEAYKASGLPPAPAVLVGDEIAGQGAAISEDGLDAIIRRHLGLAPVNP